MRDLQQCVPGVTVGSPASYTTYTTYHSSYQHFHVEEEPESLKVSWAEELSERRRKERQSRYLQTVLIVVFFLFLNRFQNNFGSVLIKNPDSDDRKDKILNALKDLDELMQGDIVLVSTKEKFITAARVWRQGFQPPLAVVEPITQEDVQKAMPILEGLSRDYNVSIRVKSGGHSFSGSSTVPDGVVLSLAKLNSTTLATNNNTNATTTAIIEPGVRMEEFLQQVLDENGYGGVVSAAASVGMGGFILGGGYGYMSRMHGLAMDNVVRIRAVLMNGTIQDYYEGDDLFWALRGAGGGNLAVVVEMEYNVYASKDMKLGAKVKLPFSQLFEFLQKLGALEPELPGEFIAMVHDEFDNINNETTTPSFSKGGDGLRSTRNNNIMSEEKNGTATVSLYWMGDSGPDQEVGMDYIKQNILPLLDDNTAGVTFYFFSWSGMTRQKEQSPTWRTVWAAQTWNGFLFPQNNTQQVWDSIQDDMATMFRYCKFLSPNIELWGGNISKVASNATAFPNRQALYNVGVQLMIPNGTENADQIFQDQVALVSAVWPSIAQHLDGTYVNYPMPSLSETEFPRAYWGDNLERLIDLKKVYDPDNVLNDKQSIPAEKE